MNLGKDILSLLYALSGYLAVDTCFLLQDFFFSILPQSGLFNSGYLLDILSQGLQRSRTDGGNIYWRGFSRLTCMVQSW